MPINKIYNYKKYGGQSMKVCYNNFFKLLNDREIRKMEIAKMADISQNTMARLS